MKIVRLLVVVLCLLLLRVSAYAQTVPVSKMQNALSGVMQNKMAGRGFLTNDPRFVSTLTSAGALIAGTVGAAAVVSAAGVTAPAWVTVVATSGLGALMTAGADLALNAVVKWLRNSDGSIQVTGAQIPNDPSLAPGQCYTTGTGSICAGTKSQVCDAVGAPNGYQSVASGNKCYWLGSANSSCPNIGDCPSADIFTKSGTPAPKTGTITFLTPTDAAAAVPSTETAKPASPVLLANLANESWMRAASAAGYSGLPYDASNPITATDVQSWQSANSASYPTVADLLAPQAAPAGGTAATPFSLPTSSQPVTSQPATSTAPGTNPAADNPLTNLGTDPGIGMPTLESVPTVAQILDPVFSLFPSLRQYTVPQHTATCPTATLNLFNHTQAFDAHCNLLEQVRAIVAAVMAAVWVFVSLRVVLSA